MFRSVTNITIGQQPSEAFPDRHKVLNLDFVTAFEATDSWRELTNTGRITIPKNLYYRDQNNKLKPLFGTNVNIGGFSEPEPLVLRGDTVSIESGYRYIDRAGREVLDVSVLFTGYISNVLAKMPIEIEVEDNMWKLKQIPVPTHTFSKTDTLETILKYMLEGTGFTVNALTSTTFGSFSIGNETVAQVLARLRKDFHFESYFRGSELRSGALVYIPAEARTQNFIFQNNIIEDELEYKRRDDVVLSAVARNTITETTGKNTKDGHAKTRKTRLEVLVTIRSGKRTVKVLKGNGASENIPTNTEGERRTLFFPGATTTDELAQLAGDELEKYYYTGLRGKFTTFAIPHVRNGDNARISDPVLPERSGLYKIRSVKYTGGTEGGRQQIELDYKIDN